ncbi:MAG TPA: hypothetical protein VG893_02115 [Terracidiphilus sp.]|nr:hypothetical protein [Terracidiphilus sp.]
MFLRTTALLLTVAAVPGLAQQSAGSGDTTALTIYNDNFAAARVDMRLALHPGVNDVTTSKVTTQLEPDSVVLTGPERAEPAFRVLEQNYDAGVVTQEWLLEKFEGKTIDFQIAQPRTAVGPNGTVQSLPAQTVKGTILRAGGAQPLIEVNGQMQFQLPGTPLFPASTDGLLLKPTLHWRIESDKTQTVDAELVYITGGLSWEATYNVLVPESADVTGDQQADILGWVTINNQTGTDFPAARIKLMAGDVAKIQPVRPMPMAVMARLKSSFNEASEAQVTQKPFDDFHLYNLNRTVELRDGEMKQVQFLEASGVTVSRSYVYDGAEMGVEPYSSGVNQDASYGLDSSNTHVSIQQEIKNTTANHLGIPLPAGRLRLYRRDSDGQMEFVGESTIDHTPAEDKIHIVTGNAFDIKGTRTQTDFRVNRSGHTIDESFSIKLTNQKAQPVTVDVREPLYRGNNWEITEKSQTYTKLDSHTVQFPVQVPAKGETTLTYSVHYTW